MFHIYTDADLHQRYANKRAQLLVVFAIGIACGLGLSQVRMSEALAQGPVFEPVTPVQSQVAACMRLPAHRRADCVREASRR